MKELDELNDHELSNDKVYLYFLQKGRCIYSGKKLNLSRLRKSNYQNDIDYIYPLSAVNDRSMNNKVLTGIQENRADKYTYFPVDSEIQKKMKGFLYSSSPRMGFEPATFAGISAKLNPAFYEEAYS